MIFFERHRVIIAFKLNYAALIEKMYLLCNCTVLLIQQNDGINPQAIEMIISRDQEIYELHYIFYGSTQHTLLRGFIIRLLL